MKTLISCVERIDKNCLFADPEFINFVCDNSPFFENILKNINYKLANGYVHITDEVSKNIWYPSLNTGIPITQKADRIHQATFIMHDFIHHLLLDPLPSEDKHVFVMSKMIGEVVSQYVADFMFINEVMSKYDPEYNFYKRKYYMFAFLATSSPSRDTVSAYTFMENIARFAVYGEVIPKGFYRRAGFMEKYRSFFQADLYWNAANWDMYQKFERKFENRNQNHLNDIDPELTIRELIQANMRLLYNAGDLRYTDNLSASKYYSQLLTAEHTKVHYDSGEIYDNNDTQILLVENYG